MKKKLLCSLLVLSATLINAQFKKIAEGPEFEDVRERYESGGIGYKESKEILIKNIIRFVSPLRDKSFLYCWQKNRALFQIQVYRCRDPISYPGAEGQ